MNKTIIIAEAGVNHNGSLALAKKLVDVAAGAGVDYVKFQTFRAEKLASKLAAKADYQKKTTGTEQTQLDMLKQLELSEADHIELVEYCRERNTRFLSTAFDLDSIDLLKRLGIRLGKIPSGEITNLPYLRKMARSFDDLILSTGMTDMNELEQSVNALIKAGCSKERLTVLHCTTEYPAPFEDVNLQAMLTIGSRLGVKTGYSDHTPGIEVPVAAVALGATIIEKHFTLDKNMEGPDHKASLEPGELVQMVKSIRHIEQALGSAEKTPSPSEIKNKVIARKSIVAAADIAAGDVFTENNLTVKRPGSGISPMQWDEVMGKKAKRDFAADELIEL